MLMQFPVLMMFARLWKLSTYNSKFLSSNFYQSRWQVYCSQSTNIEHKRIIFTR